MTTQEAVLTALIAACDERGQVMAIVGAHEDRDCSVKALTMHFGWSVLASQIVVDNQESLDADGRRRWTHMLGAPTADHSPLHAEYCSADVRPPTP